MAKRDGRCSWNELVRQVCLDGWPATLRLAFLEVVRVALLAATLWLVGRSW